MKKSAKTSNSKQSNSPLTGATLGEWMDVPTVEKRLKAARTAVVLVYEAIEGLVKKQDDDPLSDLIVVESIKEALSAAAEDLYWLSLLPKNVLDRQAPSDDQKTVMEGGPQSAAQGGGR
jgi:hypothetical protein